MSGKVYLAGAGPGDPGLLTRRVAELFTSVDVVVIDALVSDAVRGLITDAQVIYAGKRAGQHSLSQDEINDLLVRLAGEGKRVLRLKGGDPFVFGRGGEEAERLRREGIEFEIAPGITAGIAGPAYAGIPVTHRSRSTSVTFVTGHESDETSGVDWSSLAALGGTLVFYMGLGRLETISAKLREAGMSPATPAAVISRATTPLQRTVTGTLSNISVRVQESGIEAPALIVVGDVVPLSETINWFETRPLFGRTVAVTRARAQSSELARMLAERGARPVEFPMISIEPPADFDSLDALIGNLGAVDWLIVSSTNGVERFIERLMNRGRDARSLAGLRIAAVGTSTAESMKRYGLVPDLVPERYQSAALLPHFDEDLSGVTIGVVRAQEGNDEFLEELRRRGAVVQLGIAYRTVGSSEGADELRALIESGAVDALTFTSGSTVAQFVGQIGELPATARRPLCVSIGPITSRAMREHELPVDAEAAEATISSLVEAVEQVLAGRAGAGR